MAQKVSQSVVVRFNPQDMAAHPAGPQQPEKYPFVGRNYKQYGEVPGYIYDPYSDKYRRDALAERKYLQEHGALPPDAPTPSLGQQLLPIGAGALAMGGGQALGKALPDAIGSIGKGLFSMGGGGAAPVAADITQGAGGAGAFEGATAGASAAPGMFSLSGIGSAGNVMLPIAGTIGAYDTLMHGGSFKPARGALEGAASGAAIGSYFGPEGALVGAGIGGLVGLGEAVFGSSKGEDQLHRDAVRKGLVDAGALGKDYKIKLAGGGSFDMGVDGKHKLKNLDGTERHYFDVDLNNKDAMALVPSAQAIAQRFAGQDEKSIRDWTSYIVNAATSTGKTADDYKKNLDAIASQIPASGSSSAPPPGASAPAAQQPQAVSVGPDPLAVSQNASAQQLNQALAAQKQGQDTPVNASAEQVKKTSGQEVTPGLLGLGNTDLLSNNPNKIQRAA